MYENVFDKQNFFAFSSPSTLFARLYLSNAIMSDSCSECGRGFPCGLYSVLACNLARVEMEFSCCAPSGDDVGRREAKQTPNGCIGCNERKLFSNWKHKLSEWSRKTIERKLNSLMCRNNSSSRLPLRSILRSAKQMPTQRTKLEVWCQTEWQWEIRESTALRKSSQTEKEKFSLKITSKANVYHSAGEIAGQGDGSFKLLLTLWTRHAFWEKLLDPVYSSPCQRVWKIEGEAQKLNSKALKELFLEFFINILAKDQSSSESFFWEIWNQRWSYRSLIGSYFCWQCCVMKK